MQSLHTKYRPASLNEVIGQPAVVSALENTDLKSTHAYILQGPSGTGKTTVARIIANKLGCDPSQLQEIDAALHSDVEYWRKTTNTIGYRAFSGSVRCMIVDECQTLSTKAWEALLKPVEEPPDHFFWFFCTTDPNSIPKTIKTRCMALKFTNVSDDDLENILSRVVNQEPSLNLNQHTMEMIARASDGSPRKALVNLAQVANISNTEHVETLLETNEAPAEVINLIRLFRTNWTWQQAMNALKGIKEEPEFVRICVVNYYSKVAKSHSDFNKVAKCLNIVHSFKEPYATKSRGGEGQLLLSIGSLLQS